MLLANVSVHKLKILSLLGFVSAAIALSSCSEIYTDSVGSLSPAEFSSVSFETDSLDKDFVHLFAKDLFVFLGTDDTLAGPNENPKMKATFDYDFSIAKHEVTCEEFNNFAKAKKSAIKRKNK